MNKRFVICCLVLVVVGFLAVFMCQLPFTGSAPVYTSDDNYIPHMDELLGAQNKDGSWGSSDSAAFLTPMVLLGFFSRGETPASNTYGEATAKGIRYLVNCEQENQKPFTEAASLWCLSEAYLLTNNRLISEEIKRRTNQADWFSDQESLLHLYAMHSLRISGFRSEDPLASIPPNGFQILSHNTELAESLSNSERHLLESALFLIASPPARNFPSNKDFEDKPSESDVTFSL